MLPLEKEMQLPKNIFCTDWQAVIFKNYGYVSIDKIAKVLNCDEATIKQEAKRLGLIKEKYNAKWESEGYITIIRNNWYLLPYSQLLTLLGWTEEKLDFTLKEEDFLSVKLGNCKPKCKEIKYSPLTKEQEEFTKEQCKFVADYYKKTKHKYFDYFSDAPKIKDDGKVAEGVRFVHGYLSPCGNAFEMDSKRFLSDSLLKQYKEKGVNGIWIHGVLSSLSYYPFIPKLSKQYKENRANLKALVERALKFGIKIYLYFNEPRSLPLNETKGVKIIGHKEDGFGCLCLTKKETQDYLYNAVKDLFSEVKNLGGMVTITMSENLTHCHSSHIESNCPYCKDENAEESAALVNNIINRAIKDSGSKAELIANMWGWDDFMGFTQKQTMHGIDLLDKDISVLCVSEHNLKLNIAGVKNKLIDYSISNVGPSPDTKKFLGYAQKKGHKIYAKIQANNSWECSCVPCLPVFDLIYEHLQGLKEIGVNNYMLSWTLGGYPSITLDLIKSFNQEGFTLDGWYAKRFGKDYKTVKEGVAKICKGFKEYPFSMETLYFSPKNVGFANSLNDESLTLESCMVGYSFLDYEKWIAPYKYEDYISQYKKLLKGWKDGLELLKTAKKNKLLDKLILYTEVSYLHFYADLLQTQYAYAKKHGKSTKSLIEKEKEGTLKLLEICNKDATIGYEASNHYFYTDRNLLEKYLQL